MEEDSDLEELEQRLYCQVYHSRPEDFNDPSPIKSTGQTGTVNIEIPPSQPPMYSTFGGSSKNRYFKKQEPTSNTDFQNVITTNYALPPMVFNPVQNVILINPNVSPTKSAKKLKSEEKKQKYRQRIKERRQEKKLRKMLDKQIEKQNKHIRFPEERDNVICISDSEEEEKVIISSTKPIELDGPMLCSSDDDSQDVVYIEPEPVPLIDLDSDSAPEPTVAETNTEKDGLAEIPENSSQPEKTYSPNERKELLETPDSNQSNDFIDNTNLGQNSFNFSLHGNEFNNAPDQFLRPANPAEVYETDTESTSTSDFNKDLHHSMNVGVFNEVEFPKEDIFSETNLEAFGKYITPKRKTSSVKTPEKPVMSNHSTPKNVPSRYSSDSSSEESDYQDKAKNLNKSASDLPELSFIEPQQSKETEIDSKKAKKKKNKNKELIESGDNELTKSSKKKKKQSKEEIDDFLMEETLELETPIKNKKKKKRSTTTEIFEEETIVIPNDLVETSDPEKPTKTKKKKKKSPESKSDTELLEEPYISESKNKKKKRKSFSETEALSETESLGKHKKKKKHVESHEAPAEETLSETETPIKRKKKKRNSEAHDDNDNIPDTTLEENDVAVEKTKKKKRQTSEGNENEEATLSSSKKKKKAAKEVSEIEETDTSKSSKRKKKRRSCDSRVEDDDSNSLVGENTIADQENNESKESEATETHKKKKKKQISESLIDEPDRSSWAVEEIGKTTLLNENTNEEPQKKKKKKKQLSETKSEDQDNVSLVIEEISETTLKTIESKSELNNVAKKHNNSEENTIAKKDTDTAITNEERKDIIENTQLTYPEENKNALLDSQPSKPEDIIEVNEEKVTQENLNKEPTENVIVIKPRPEKPATKITEPTEPMKKEEDIIDVDKADSDVEEVASISQLIVIDEVGSDHEDVQIFSESDHSEDNTKLDKTDLTLANCPTANESSSFSFVIDTDPDNSLYADRTTFQSKWTPDKNAFYTTVTSKNFDIEALQSTMNDDPKCWEINQDDKFCISRGSRGIKCRNCREEGHIAVRCPNRKEDTCILCGQIGHMEPRCPNKLCTQCGNEGNYSTNYCYKCFKFRTIKCNLCHMYGHQSNKCPDLWRRYHLTTEEGPPVKSTYPRLKPKNQQWCSGCAKSGHLEQNCNYLNRMYPSSDISIHSYDDIYGYKSTPSTATTQAEISEPYENNRASTSSSSSRPVSMDPFYSQSDLTSQGLNLIIQLANNQNQLRPLMQANNYMEFGNVNQHQRNPYMQFQNINPNQMIPNMSQSSLNPIAFLPQYGNQNLIVVSPQQQQQQPQQSNDTTDKNFFLRTPLNQIKPFLTRELNRLNNFQDAQASVFRKEMFNYDRAKNTMSRGQSRQYTYWCKRLNMFLFGFHKFSDGKKHLDNLKSVQNLPPNYRLNQSEIDSLHISYQYIFAEERHVFVNYHKLLNVLLMKERRTKYKFM